MREREPLSTAAINQKIRAAAGQVSKIDSPRLRGSRALSLSLCIHGGREIAWLNFFQPMMVDTRNKEAVWERLACAFEN